MVLRQFHLHLGLRRFGAGSKNIQYQVATVYSLHTQHLAYIAYLRAGKLIIKYHQVDALCYYIFFDLLQLALAHKCFAVGLRQLLHKGLHSYGAGSLCQESQLAQVLLHQGLGLFFMNKAYKHGLFFILYFDLFIEHLKN